MKRMILIVLGTLLYAISPVVSHADSATVAGAATVIDGRTLVVAGKTFRLAGIDAPDIGQPCQWPNKTIDCGNVARTALMDLVAGSQVICALDPSATGEAQCRADGFDIGGNLIHTGWAVAAEDGPAAYKRTQAKARAAKRGLWKGTFEMPWVWRRTQ